MKQILLALVTVVLRSTKLSVAQELYAAHVPEPEPESTGTNQSALFAAAILGVLVVFAVIYIKASSNNRAIPRPFATRKVESVGIV